MAMFFHLQVSNKPAKLTRRRSTGVAREHLYSDSARQFEVLQLSPRQHDTIFEQNLKLFHEQKNTHMFFPINISYKNMVTGAFQTWHHDIGCVYASCTEELIYFDSNGADDSHQKSARAYIDQFLRDFLQQRGLKSQHPTKFVVRGPWQGDDALCVIDTWFFLYRYCEHYKHCAENAYADTVSYYGDSKNKRQRKATLQSFYDQARKAVRKLGSSVNFECKALSDEYQRLQAKHETLVCTYNKLDEKHNALKDKNKEECNELRDKHQRLQAEHDALQAEHDALQAEHDALDRAYATLNRVYDGAEDKRNELYDKYQRLQAEHDAHQVEHKALARAYDTLKDKHAALEDKYKNAHLQSTSAVTPPPAKRARSQLETPELPVALWERDLDGNPNHHALVCRNTHCPYNNEDHTSHGLYTYAHSHSHYHIHHTNPYFVHSNTKLGRRNSSKNRREGVETNPQNGMARAPA